ncbi:prolyl-tRNA synthetase associated domain-containing protein [Ideonella livida]|uniref:Prolyl-tRNA synthetase associated domain-containing protein n=1 Tax=Ideonella livida TaxID=2707176 RepID=A0A7C9PH18_9BURK|nr:prolyl-tRNA synthetase associated domain-containing protein [Ideonella livida]NDY91777.1 prolyl-tRNA synthetase associated domain-containing protein [Ideonella livida]
MQTPQDTAGALASAPTSEDLLRLLAEHGIAYDLVEHEAVFTIAEALAATPEIGGIKTKNVFLRDGKGVRHFLVVVPHDVRLDLPGLAAQLGVAKLSMGSADRLLRHLGVTPGAVSVFALLHDRARAVELVLDERVHQADALQAHPLRNTATVALGRAGLDRFLNLTGHSARVLAV